MATIRTPSHLSEEAKGLWKKITTERVLPDSYLIVLRVGLEAFDRLQEARRILGKEGCYYKSGTLKKENPYVKIEKEARAGFLQAWRLLNLNVGDIPNEEDI